MSTEIPITTCSYVLCKKCFVPIFLIEIVGIVIEEVIRLALQISGKTLSRYVNKVRRMGNMNTEINYLPFARVLHGI
jgi:hypothetical protein